MGVLSSPVFVAIITTLMGGSFLTALISVYTARKKVPVERDSIIVSGAETAVMALERTLAAETKRADRAEALVALRDEQLARKDERIEALTERLDKLQVALDEARDELVEILKVEHNENGK